MKNLVLKGITFVAVIIAVICICCIDSANREVFEIGLAFSGIWLILFIGVNWDRIIRKANML